MFPPAFIFAFLIQFTIGKNAVSQCTVEKLRSDCSSILDPGYKLSRIIDLNVEEERKVEEIHTVILSKGFVYELKACTPQENNQGLQLSIFNMDDNLIVSNYNRERNKYYSKMLFKCQSSGLYYLKTNKSSTVDCATATIGFKSSAEAGL